MPSISGEPPLILFLLYTCLVLVFDDFRASSGSSLSRFNIEPVSVGSFIKVREDSSSFFYNWISPIWTRTLWLPLFLLIFVSLSVDNDDLFFCSPPSFKLSTILLRYLFLPRNGLFPSSIFINLAASSIYLFCRGTCYPSTGIFTWPALRSI